MLRRFFPLVRNVAASTKQNFNASIITSKRNYGIYEPDYLESLKPKYPEYEAIDFQIKGYDYPILESYQKFLHGVAEYMDLDVSECWALPPRKFTAQRFKPNSAVVDAEYKLTIYERNLQIASLPAPIYPVFLRIAQAALPEGVTINVLPHTEEIEEIRYVPDRDLLELRAQLETLQTTTGPKKK